MAKNDWHSFRNVLCVRLDNMGDLIMTMPAIRAVKNNVTSRKITLLTSHAAAGVAATYPEIDSIITFDAPWISNANEWNTVSINTLINLIAKRKFDASIIFTGYSQSPLPSAFICKQAGIANVLSNSKENPYNLVSDWVPDIEPLYQIKHEVTRQLDLVAEVGIRIDDDGLFLPVNHDAKKRALNKISRMGFRIDLPWLVLHPGVSEARRQYPPDLYARAAADLAKRGMQIVVTGSESERKLTQNIKTTIGDMAFATGGSFNTKELIGLISASPLVISNNTGIAHIAAALQTPLIDIYATTNPQHYPWKVKHELMLFTIPRNAVSKNTFVRYVYDKLYNKKVYSVKPEDIVKCALEILA